MNNKISRPSSVGLERLFPFMVCGVITIKFWG